MSSSKGSEAQENQLGAEQSHKIVIKMPVLSLRCHIPSETNVILSSIKVPTRASEADHLS